MIRSANSVEISILTICVQFASSYLRQDQAISQNKCTLPTMECFFRESTAPHTCLLGKAWTLGYAGA